MLVQEVSGVRRSFKVANRRSDHDRLSAFLKSLPGHVVAAVEPTGDYHRPLAYRLLSEGIEVVSISSVALARVREARFGTWDKNDPKDAQVILSMLAQRMVQTYYDPLIAGTHDLQKLQSGQSRGREALSKRGNKRLRMVFWMAGLRAIHMRENAFRDKYERYLSENPFDTDRKRKALTAKMVYAVIKNGSDYHRFFEQRLPSGSIPLARAVEAT